VLIDEEANIDKKFSTKNRGRARNKRQTMVVVVCRRTIFSFLSILTWAQRYPALPVMINFSDDNFAEGRI
jgi:hypothetical protein